VHWGEPTEAAEQALNSMLRQFEQEQNLLAAEFQSKGMA
jgi:hypothetical protein